MTSKKDKEGKMKEIVRKTVSVSKELEALVKEHETILSKIKNPLDCSEEDFKEEDLGDKGFEALYREEKALAVNQTLKALKKGMEEAEMMIMLANYTSSLESDKVKLKTQVKRLCGENNWLRKSLTESQQLLQEAEVSMSKLAVEKEHLEFLHSQKNGSKNVKRLDSFVEIDEQEEDVQQDALPVRLQVGAAVSGIYPDLSGLDASADYDIPEKIRTLHQLALQYVNQGKPEVAVPLCRKAIQELEQKLGRSNPDLASLLNILAVIYKEQGRFKEAIHVLRETLEIRETVFGMKHAIVASTLNNLSVLHGKCGDYKTAEPFCQRALEIRQELLGADHPDVAKQFCNLAILCSHLGRYDEVEHYYQRALEIFQAELGQDDPNITKTMNNLANCYLKQGKYKVAESMFRKVLKSVQSEERTRQRKQSSGEGVRCLGEAVTDIGSPSPRLGELAHWHKISPLQSPTVVDTLRSLTDTYRGQGRMEDAAKLEKLTRASPAEKNCNDCYFSQILGEMDALENARSSTPKHQEIRPKQSLLNLGWVFKRSDTPGAIKLAEPTKNRHRRS